MFKYTLTITAIPIVIQEVKEKYTPLVIIILYLSIYMYKLLPPQLSKPTNGKIPTKDQSVATKAMIVVQLVGDGSLQFLTLLFNTAPRMRKLYICIYGNKIIAMLLYIVLQPPGTIIPASNCYTSSVLQCLMNHSIF